MTPTPQADLDWPLVPLPTGLGPVRGGAMQGPDIPASPDPLVRYTWQTTPPEAEVQLFSLKPHVIDYAAAVLADPDGDIWITDPGVMRLDFGIVAAGWFQFASPNLGDPESVEIGIAAHGDGARVLLRPVRHGEVYRLEPTPELYEGVRFAYRRSCVFRIYRGSLAGLFLDEAPDRGFPLADCAGTTQEKHNHGDPCGRNKTKHEAGRRRAGADNDMNDGRNKKVARATSSGKN